MLPIRQQVVSDLPKGIAYKKETTIRVSSFRLTAAEAQVLDVVQLEKSL